MNSLTNIPTRIVATATSLAGAALLAIAPIQILDEQSSQTTAVGIEHVTLGLFSAFLVLLIPVVLYIGARTGRERIAIAGAASQLTLAALATLSNVRGEDPAFFPAVAAPTNLIIFATLITLGVALRKRLGAPLWIAVALPLAHVFALPLSQLGGTAVAGAFWVAIAWLTQNDRLSEGFSAAPAAQTAAATSR